MEADDAIRVFCDSANAIDVSLSILQERLMADRNGYIGRAPGDSSVIIARQTSDLLEYKQILHFQPDIQLVILMYI